MRKKHLILTLIFLFVLLILPGAAVAYDYNDTTYNDNDFTKLQTFLNLPSAIEGKTNGQCINESYNEDDPETWTGIVWTDGRVTKITFPGDEPEKILNGDLDLSEFTSLTEVACAYNSIDSINVTNDTALKKLLCYANSISSIDVSTNTLLEDLECAANPISSIDVSNNTLLTRIDCGEDQLNSLDVSNNTLLTHLYCYKNNLTSLDVSNNTNLITLDCRYNQLTLLDVSNNTNLTSLECNSNNLTSLDVSMCTSLDNFFCNVNNISYLKGYFFGKVTNAYATGNGYISCQYDERYSIDPEFTAAPVTDATFVNWKINDEVVSTSPTYTFTSALSGDLIATFSPLTVSFDTNEGSTIDDITAEYDSTIAAPSAPAKTGYTFNGWYIDEGLNTLWNFASDTITADATLYAEWIPLPYTVTFDSNGGTEVEAITADYDSKISAPAEPTQTGYKFDGWYKDEELSTAWDFDVDTVTENITLYAKWIKLYKITYIYDSSAGKWGYEEENSIITPPDDPSPGGPGSGYTFKGWYYESNFINQWDGQPITVTSDLTLYARWLKDGYDENDYFKIQQFLCSPSAESGKINGQVINPSWGYEDENNPSAWLGITWNTDAQKKIITINWGSINYLKGACDLSNCTKLESFFHDDNQNFISLNFNNCTSLTYVECENCMLSSIDLSNCTSLMTLDCLVNQLADLNLSDCTNLEVLQCGGNQLSTLVLSNNTKLKQLNCSHNDLNTLDLSNNTLLEKLTCINGPLNEIDLSNCSKLVELNLIQNNLTSLNLNNNAANLNTLDFSENQISSIDVSHFPQLTYFNCKDNLINGTLDLSNNPNLESLYCQNNTISEIKYKAGDIIKKISCSGMGSIYIETSSFPSCNVTRKSQSGVTFLGWNIDGEILSTNYYYNLDTLESDTLIAVFSKAIVDFDSRGGSNVDSQTADYNSLISEPISPTCEDDTFIGWYKEPECKNIWNFETDKVTTNITLYAAWNSNIITFQSNGGDIIDTISADYGTTITAPSDPTKTGYDFAGWYKDDGFASAWNFATDKVTTNTTLCAKWTIKSYTVSFESNNGSSIDDIDANYNTTITKPSDPTKTGYDFAGWYKDDGFASAWNFATDKVTANTTLYAKWTIKSYTVSFDSNDGNTVDDIDTNYNTTITKPSDPTKTGYDFAGWYKDNGFASAWNFATDKVTANTTLYAKWTINSYIITFNSNGGSTVGSISANYNTTITKPTYPTKIGCTFAGWYKNSVLTTAWNFSTDKVTANTTLYAKWTINKYTVSVSVNNTSYGSVSGAGTYDYNTTATLKATPKAGYRFIRWLEGTTTVSTNSTYAFKVTKGRTLKAEFTKIAIPSISSAYSSGYNSVTLKWDSVTGAKSYNIYRATSKSGAYSKIASTSSTSYKNTRLTTGKTYYYKVKAVCVAGSTTTYSSYSSYKYIKPIPSTPSLTVKSSSYKSIKISWGKVSGASGYRVYRATSKSGKYKLIKTTTSTRYTNSSLRTGKRYYYKVRPYKWMNSKRIYGNYSSIKSAKPIPSTPSVTVKSSSYKSVKISWKKVSGVSGYRVYRATSKSGKYKLIKTTTSTRYTNSSLRTGKRYYYKVRAYKYVSGKRVYGKYSSIKSAKPVPSRPSSFSVRRYSSSKIKISYGRVSGASGYRIYRATSRSGTYKLVKTTTSRSWINTGRTKGKRYYYKVRAYKWVSGKRVYGPYTTIRYTKT